MKLQPESKKELKRILCGAAICTAVMWVVFAALGLVGWVRFDLKLVLSSLVGDAVAVGNFALLWSPWENCKGVKIRS